MTATQPSFITDDMQYVAKVKAGVHIRNQINTVTGDARHLDKILKKFCN